MNRPAARLLFFFVSAALLAGFFMPSARADGPALTAKFGVAGRYKPGGWCLVTVGVTNPGPDTVTGQLQVVATDADTGSSPFGPRRGRANASPAVFACPVSVPGGTTAPRDFPIYVRGIDPGQADLTVQLVEGRERGDGRVLAKISNQNPNEAVAFSGSAVSSGDSLLIGFGGDPGAFLFLNSRRVPFGNVSNGTPATEQIAEASAADLPDRAAGYAGAEAFLLRSDAPLDALTEAQTEALKAWVASGGHLIICGGSDPSRFAVPFFEGLLPAAIGAGSTLTLTPKQTPGVRVVQAAPDGSPQIVTGPYGAGVVTLTAFDPTLPVYPMLGPMALPGSWQAILAAAPTHSSSVLTVTAQHEENTNAFYFGNTPPLLSEAVMRGPSLDAPGTVVIAVFLLAYLILLVPVNYLVLKRMDRKEWAWGTIPALVLLFAAGTFGVGYAAKGGSVFVNRAALIETSAGCRQAGVYSEVGLFSPRRSSYDIDLTGDNLVSAIPNPGTDYSGRGGNSQEAGSAQFVETPAGVSLPNTPVNMWAMRAFDVQSAADLGGTIDGSLTDKTGTATGTIVNRTPYALTDCAVCVAGHWRSVGPIASGGTLTVSGNEAVSGDLPLPPHNTEDAGSDIHERMQDALGRYFRSLSERQPSYNGMNTGLAYAPAQGEALFAGWSRDPHLAGPAPKIDGQAAAENDESLIIVHLPVSGAPLSMAPVPPSTGAASGASLGPGGFGAVGRATLSYRQALDTRALSAGQAAALTGHVTRLRGTVTGLSQNSRFNSTTLGFAPNAAPLEVKASLPFCGWRNPAARTLVGREVVVTGTLTRAGSGFVLVVSHPNWVQIVL